MDRLKRSEIVKLDLTDKEKSFVETFGEENCEYLYFIEDFDKLSKMLCEHWKTIEIGEVVILEMLNRHFKNIKRVDNRVLCVTLNEGELLPIIIAEIFATSSEDDFSDWRYLTVPYECFRERKLKGTWTKC